MKRLHNILFSIGAIIAALSPTVALAVTSGYSQFYMPAYSDNTDAGSELTLSIGTILSSDAWPEAAVTATLFPHYVHAAGYGVDAKTAKESANINPASTMHLAVDMNAYPEKTCAITLDITNMTLPSDVDFPNFKNALKDKAITMTEALEYVVRAIEKNFAMSGYNHSCAFSIKGMEKHPEVRADMKPNSPLLKTVLQGGSNAAPH